MLLFIFQTSLEQYPPRSYVKYDLFPITFSLLRKQCDTFSVFSDILV